MAQKNIIKTDFKDRKILANLEMNSRMTVSRIAKSAGISKASVSARIGRLVKGGLVERFLPVLNYDALGVSKYRLYCKFEITPEKFEEELSDYLYAQGNVHWFALTQGEWDVVIRLFAASSKEVEKFESGFMEKFGKYVKAKMFGINLLETTSRTALITGNQGSHYHEMRDYSGGQVPLSKKDYRILYWLYENSRMPLRDIARKEGLSPDVVAYRIRKMEKNKVFFGYTARFNRAKLGLTSSKILINFQHLTPKRRGQFMEYCDAHPNFSYFGLLLGGWDMEADIDSRDMQELYSILRQIHAKFPDIIRDLSVLPKIKEFHPNPVAHLARKAVLKSAIPEFEI